MPTPAIVSFFVCALLLGTACATESGRRANPRGAASPSSLGSSSARSKRDSSSASAAAVAIEWRTTTESPRPPAAHTSIEEAMVSVCAGGDGALDRVAARAARALAAGAPLLEGPELVFALRAEGQPHMAPRAWALRAAKPNALDTANRFRRALSASSAVGALRCGASELALPDGAAVVVGVAAIALADLSKVPTTARLGQWIRFEGRSLEAIDYAKIVALGPVGTPRSIPTSFSSETARGVFSVDRPGQWIVQLLTSSDAATRPVLEATIFVDVEPPTRFELASAPGEDADLGSLDDEVALHTLLNRARLSEGMRSVARHAKLDALARTHAASMRAARAVSHDVGSGDPVERLEKAGLGTDTIGENVARASGVQGAHRALWWSPSHRANLLDGRFDVVGVGVAREGETVWVCELFADFAVAGIDQPTGRWD